MTCFENIIDNQIFDIVSDLLEKSSLSVFSKKEILDTLALLVKGENKDNIDCYFNDECLKIKHVLDDLSVDYDVKDGERRKVKKYEFLRLILYLFKVKEYILNNDEEAAYELILNDYLEKVDNLSKGVPGISLGIKDGIFDHTLLVYSGYLSGDEDLKVDFDSRFDMASITKMFTALKALKLNEEGLFNIFKSVNDYDHNYDISHSLLSLGSFNCKVVTDGRLDDDLSLDEIRRRVYGSKVLDDNTFLYSDIPYIIIGSVLPKADFVFSDLTSTSYDRSFGNLTGSWYEKLDKVHDAKARGLLRYGINPGHAGIYSNSFDLLKLFDKFNSGFLSDDSLNILRHQSYPYPVLFSSSLPVISLKNGVKKYENVNRGFGVYVSHPYGLKHTDVPDVMSKDAFAASGFTGCFCAYDLDNQFSTNILTNPYSGLNPVKDAKASNDVKVHQCYYVYALRLLQNSLKERGILEGKSFYEIPKSYTLKR